MRAQALVLVAIRWTFVSRCVLQNVAAAFKPEGSFPPSGEESTAMQRAPIAERFQESYDRQSGSGIGDLAIAVEGYDLLARERRGPAWPGHASAENDASETGRACWSGDRRRESGATSATTTINAVTAGGSVREDDGAGCLEAFLAAKDNAVREFFTRSGDNFALVSTGNLRMPAMWGLDVFSPLARGNNFVTALHKLDHDREQLEYLIEKKRLPQEFEQLAKEYGAVRETIAADISKDHDHAKEGIRGIFYAIGSDHFEILRGTYNSFMHAPRDPADGMGGTRSMGPRVALNPDLDWEAIEKEYLSKDLPLVWFDGFLSQDALEGVLEYCREATVFFDVKVGYLGAYLNEGLSSPWLIQIARELQQRLPRVLEGMTISNIWAYKFDSDTSLDGIKVHADAASVNLNFWVTPDDANLDPSSGGLVVYPKEPPHGGGTTEDGGSKLDEEKWNNFAQESFIKSWLKDEGVYDLAVTVPYRQNRVVMFDSRLLHETDTFRFRKGYENRRINLTFLFSRA